MGREKSGQIITFYSYKGGTGRSMALANVACLLAQRPKAGRVLMIDWDLEAPGLHRYFQGHVKHHFRNTKTRERDYDAYPGVIDLFADLKKAIKKFDSEDDPDDEDTDKLFGTVKLEDYILPTDIESLDLLKAGNFDPKSNYPNRVNSFRWDSLFAQSPWLFGKFASRLAKQYDYVLIDSRTGLTDISGICTTLLPDKLVVVFTPNRQSLTGVLEKLIPEALNYRRNSAYMRPLTVFPLPSRIELAEDQLRQDWRQGNRKEGIAGYQPEFEELLKKSYDLPECDLQDYFDKVQIRHQSSYAYGEKIAVLTNESQDDINTLSYAYRKFTERLTTVNNPWETQTTSVGEPQEQIAKIGNEGHAARDKGDLNQAIQYYEQALDLSRKLEDRGNELTWLHNLANAFAVVGQQSRAVDYYLQALKISQEIGDRRTEASILGNLGNIYAVLRQTERTIELNQQALSISLDIGDLRGACSRLINLGNAYVDMNQPDKAVEHYEQALDITQKLDDQRTQGVILADLGNAYFDMKQLEQAIQYYEQALGISRELKDQYIVGTVLGNLGDAYGTLGQTDKAIDYYEQALTISREIGDQRTEGGVLANLGSIFHSLNKLDLALSYYQQARSIFKKLNVPGSVEQTDKVIAQIQNITKK
jgi:tetratricopeptide (TPR) repeat protein